MTVAHAAKTPAWTAHPRVAAGLSAVPGLGQIYNGQIARGVVLFLGTALSMGASVFALMWSIGTGPSVFNRYGLLFLLLAVITIVVFLVGFIFSLYVWGSAAHDAYRCARSRVAGDIDDAGIWHPFRL